MTDSLEVSAAEVVRAIARRLRAELRRATNAEPETVTAKELELLEGED